MGDSLKANQYYIFILIGILHLLYLFIGLSNQSLRDLSFFYVMMLDGAILSGFMLFGKDMPDKFGLLNINIFSIAVGIVIAEVMVMVELGFYGALTYVLPYSFTEAMKGYIYMITIAFIIGNTEEIFFRGFLPAVVLKFGKNATDIKISNYILSPALFGIAHYFSWANSTYITPLLSIYMFLYHFTFGVAMQFLRDKYESLYPSIASHIVYDATKMILRYAQ